MPGKKPQRSKKTAHKQAVANRAARNAEEGSAVEQVQMVKAGVNPETGQPIPGRELKKAYLDYYFLGFKEWLVQRHGSYPFSKDDEWTMLGLFLHSEYIDEMRQRAAAATKEQNYTAQIAEMDAEDVNAEMEKLRVQRLATIDSHNKRFDSYEDVLQARLEQLEKGDEAAQTAESGEDAPEEPAAEEAAPVTEEQASEEPVVSDDTTP